MHPLDGTYGIGHTRWATHGHPTKENAHPHRDCTGRVVVVHNGIIENYLTLKKKLSKEGHRFTTETDTEIIAHLIEKYFLKTGNGHRPSLEQAVRNTVKELAGVFALAVIAVDEPDKIVAARNGPPAVIGLGKEEYFVASDVPAILYHTRDLFFLADGDLAVITPEGVQLSDFDGRPIVHQVQHLMWDPIMAEKGGFKHFMLKEIYEQPRAVCDTMRGRISQDTGRVSLEGLEISEAEVKAAQKINIAACGTSWHAGQAGKFMVREPGPHPSGGRLRQRVALPRSHYRARHAHPADITVGRDGGHDCGAARSQGQGIEDDRHLQRGGFDDHARGGGHDLHPRRAGNRGGFDQGLHRTADCALLVCAVPGAGPWHHDG
jgi:glucosamine--fructose-6-phosphate aminotransferase (isomerizing)